ncbi:uncharacterized protein LOC143180080 [Calliopsis andreniformis]|uniref:uncharacterized protein LOC143180080 n=1 Tax=Calliopsis andreniformis TaxID=337506 RepID=UPI003FCD2C52
MHTLAEPRDNKEIFPPHGSLHKSSYRRLGPDDGCTGVTETQAMLSQIELKHLYERVYPQRTLLNMKSLAAEGVEEKKEFSMTDALFNPAVARCMDYRTTMEIDYRLPHPMRPRPPPPPPPPEPWLLNRRTIGYSLEELEKRHGRNTFLDDNMEVHARIAELKSKRYKLHDIMLEDSSDVGQTTVPDMKKEKVAVEEECPCISE